MSNSLRQFLGRLGLALDPCGEPQITDVELLQHFCEGRDEAAFEVLVRRYGPMVVTVCQHILQNSDDAEDAFQATFLVLVRRAASLRKAELLGNWLYGVAQRVALRVRVQEARRRVREKRRAEMLETLVAKPRGEVNEWAPALYEELNRLPEKYRAPIEVCYLQGKTNEEAANLLDWPIGTVKGRLNRARELLRKRLTRRGVTLSTVALAATLTPSAGSAAVPAALLESTVRAAKLFAAGKVATATASGLAVAVANGVLRTMYVTKVLTVCGIAVGTILLGTTTAVYLHRTRTAAHMQAQPVALAESPAQARDDPKRDGQKGKANEQADEESVRQQSVRNLKTLAFALRSYHDEHGQFPPAAIYSKDGKALLSWRVLLLPYLDQANLFRQFKLNEPWDGTTNKKLLDRMPEVYALPGGKGKGTQTIYQVLTGAETIFPSPNATRDADITDGIRNTILIVEAADPVPWMKPADLTYAPKKPLPKLGGISKEGFQAAFADGSVRLLPRSTKEEILRAYITRNGGEIIP